MFAKYASQLFAVDSSTALVFAIFVHHFAGNTCTEHTSSVIIVFSFSISTLSRFRNKSVVVADIAA